MRDETTTFESPGISDAARKVSQGLGELGRALQDRRRSVVEPVSELVQQRPLAAIGIAFGVGYVLGGGLFTSMTGRALRLGWKLGGMALAKNLLANMGGPMGEGF